MEDRLLPYTSVRSLGAGPALVLAPHCDDEILGCGGAIIRHLEAGDAVTVIVLTDGRGERAVPDASEYVARRKTESRAAAQLLGYPAPTFWDLPDRGLRYGEPLIGRLVEASQAARAAIVYAPSVLEVHPDHRALAMAAVEAVRRLGQACVLAQYEVGVPLRPNRLLDITDLQARKRAAVECFASQLAERDYLRYVDGLNRFRAYSLPPAVEAAEAYTLSTAEMLDGDPLGVYLSDARRYRERGAALDADRQPLVSVIVRSIGRPSLDEALDSLALQTYPRVEVVVVNAAGAEHPPLPEWCGPFPLRLVGTGASLSRSQAANVGLDAAAGSYLAFLDDDDLVDPDHLAVLLERLTAQPDALAAYSGVRLVDQRGAGVAEAVAEVFHEPFNPQRLVYENYLPIHAVVFHRALLDKGCRFDESLSVYEDWDFWLQVVRHVELARVDRVTASYRSGGGSRVGLGHEQQREVLAHRRALYAKWLRRWDGETIDVLFDEYRETRFESGKRIAALEAARAELTERLAATHRALEKDRADLERCAVERDRSAAELGALQGRYQAAAEEVEGLKAERDGWMRTTQLLQGSASWRITAPVRWLTSRLRGRRGA